MKINLAYIPDNTAGLLKDISALPFISQFTLVGGTALALQLGHRQSEDLDFIFDGEKIQTTLLKRGIAKAFPHYKLLREEKDYQLDFLINQVKVTFFSTGAICLDFKVKDYSEKYQNFYIAPIETIAVLKIATIAQRNTIRDYYDLYFIARHRIPLSRIIEKGKELLPGISPITYTETIIYTKDITEQSIANHLNPKEIITKEEISGFFIEELKKMRG